MYRIEVDMKSKIINNIVIVLFIVVTVTLAYFLFYNKDKEGIIELKLNDTFKTIYVGDSERLLIEIKPNKYTSKDLVWTSEDKEIVSINEEGIITGNSIGNTIIKVSTKDGKIGSKCYIEVKESFQ
jgi:hypothetical protein